MICPQNQKWKFNLIQCPLHRVYIISSSWITFSQEVDFLKGVFSQNGYPEDLFTSCLRRFVNNKCDEHTLNSKIKEDRVETVFFIPYIGLPSIIFSQKLKEVLKKYYCIDIRVVFTSFLFIIYTNALSLCSTTCKIIKYADDTVVIGLINNDNEQEYRDTVSYVSSWCNENHLNLNAGKTKEMIFDFRKIQNDKAPVIINNTSVKQVPSYKYLGVIIQNNLKWNEHVTAQVKKADQRMYHVRRLSKLKIDNEILCLFYNSTVSSVLVYAVPCWFNLCDEKQKKDVCKFAKRMKKMTGDCNQVENPRMISTKKCKCLISKMVKDETHPLHPYITTLPHGHLRVPWSRTERFRKSFLPYAIKLFNSD